jgi:hypothetical protein
VSSLFDRERGTRSAALTLAGPRLCSGYPGHVMNPASQTQTETLTDLICVRGLWFYLVRSWLLLNRRGMGYVAAEFLPERNCIVRINLDVIASTRDRGHRPCAPIEQIPSAQLGVHVNQNTVGSLLAR